MAERPNDMSVVFLVDKIPPTNIILLKRAADRTFAPGWSTGIGGKYNTEDKTLIDGALRELQEETGIDDVPLTEFARVIIDGTWRIYYFWGIYGDLEIPECNEGELERIPIGRVFSRALVRTTRGMLTEWSLRGFEVDKPFTLYTEKIEKIRNGEERILGLKEGLLT